MIIKKNNSTDKMLTDKEEKQTFTNLNLHYKHFTFIQQQKTLFVMN